jgi:REP element-mobilizing transposase RayT
VTLRVREDVPSLRTVKLVRRLESSLARGCERGDFRVAHYSLQGNHAHFIVEAKDREALGRGMKSLTKRLVHAVNGVFGRRGPVLADRYHLRILRTPREVRRALAYVLLNARRHAPRRSRGAPRGESAVDPASSGRWFDGWKRSVRAVQGGAGPPPVARPHSWLLRAGWRRHGLVDPSERPGT